MKTTEYRKHDQLVHCAKCNGVLLKNVEKKDMSGEVSFLTRCPHCGGIVDIKLSLQGNFLEMSAGT
jgi:DnaJ-class molecular chaperone